ncbi:YegP family protein [Microbacterium sp. SA39]|uniref:YegP family protein n=1 Tax=Microbacterium sp. SA39 TaxID=1263625 RepID=UPI00061F4A25|nr:DUF1508 domain-containing protein [Microbacterium sp. SA39]KJQ52510.1 hypothetical protein RS85_03400 [Microbacterium sp. SA39]
MTHSEATLLAAIIAAVVAGGGLIWSIISFVLVRRAQRATDAREQWAQRFEQAHALALSADAREARTGLMLIEALTKEQWVTDEDRATAVSVLSALSHTDAATAGVRAGILGDIANRDIAAVLAEAPVGPKGRFEVFADVVGGYCWRLRAANGEVLAVGEPAQTKAAALRSLEQARRHLGGGETVTVSDN